MTRHRIWAIALAVLALSLVLAACGEKSEETTGDRESLSLTLDFYPNPDHAGIYMGEKLGYFEEAGLDLSIATPSDPALPIKAVATGSSDLALSYEPEVALAREQGLDVVAIAALVNRPLTSLIWLQKSGIKGVGDLEGKTVATAGIPYQDAFLKTILARVKLTPEDVKSVNVGFGLLPALLGGSAQAMLGGFSNVEGIDLRERGKAPVVTPVDQLGVPTYDELVLVARRASLEADPEKFRLFLAALERGTDAAVQQPDAATQAVTEANPDLEPKLTAAEVKATLPLLGARTKGQPYGYMDPEEWSTFAGWMRDNGLIDSLPTAGELLDNGYLPSGEIPE
ncbi:MAG TPA: ABC transporter substrate-binding protein [Solirubrobacterales bacterium]|jgi:putative hydroxymethylpyrimidine transport system substrate-binding protein|nr:ABC transporter substrate-binding protein [Solirubrobacterales bacterium]